MSSINKDLREIAKYLVIPVLVLVLHFIVLAFTDVYTKFPWLDIPLHFLGGFLAAYFFIFSMIYFRKQNYLKYNKLFLALYAISFVSLIAVLWEFFEFSIEYLTGLDFQGTLQDTMGDLFMGLVGGVVAIVVFWRN